MGSIRMSGAVFALLALAACDVSGLSSQAYPGRTQVAFMSADSVTQMTYACAPSDTERQTQVRASQAHRYVDGAIRSATRRITVQGGLGGGLAARAEMNTEIAQIAKQAEAEYRCVLINRKDISGFNPFGGS
jgi:hypothetical protein